MIIRYCYYIIHNIILIKKNFDLSIIICNKLRIDNMNNTIIDDVHEYIIFLLLTLHSCSFFIDLVIIILYKFLSANIYTL